MEARDIILRPVITEASTAVMDEKRYTFDVDLRATKTQVKNAVEEIFDVKVVKVNIMNLKGKKKRQGVTLATLSAVARPSLLCQLILKKSSCSVTTTNKF